MNESERAFLIILRDAVQSGKGVNIENDLKTDWTAVLSAAKKQNLFPLVYDAATAYPSFSSFEDTHPEYFASSTASMTAQERMKLLKKYGVL